MPYDSKGRHYVIRKYYTNRRRTTTRRKTGFKLFETTSEKLAREKRREQEYKNKDTLAKIREANKQRAMQEREQARIRRQAQVAKFRQGYSTFRQGYSTFRQKLKRKPDTKPQAGDKAYTV